MRRKLKSVSSLSTLAATSVLTGSLALVGCGSEGEGEGEQGQTPSTALVASEGEGEGEGEGKSHAEGEGAKSGEGEGEGAAEGEGEGGTEGEGEQGASLATNNAAFLTHTGQIRGHLWAFLELHKAGSLEQAATHVKHPESELYSALTPAMEARSIEGFAPALTTLADAAISGGDVEAAYAAVMSELDRVEQSVGATEPKATACVKFLPERQSRVKGKMVSR